MTVPVLLDCDPGHDDVFAIWLAAAHPNIDLQAITTVGGNGLLEYTSMNARVACTVAGVTDVPIAAGANQPLERALIPADWIHGENALGGPVLPDPTMELDERTASQLILDTIAGNDEPIVIIATGPLTNIAQFVLDHPDRLDGIARVVWMGGSTTRGNVTPYAEFNAWTDPRAVDVVVRSGIDFTMVGLNITHQALITPQVIADIRAIGNDTAAFGAELLEFFCSTYAVAELMPEGPLHDPVAVALVAAPELITTQSTHLDVELDGTYTVGATSADLIDILQQPHNAHVALDLDVDGFWALVQDAVRSLR